MIRKSDWLVWGGFAVALALFFGATGWALWRSDLFVEKERILLRADTGVGLTTGMAVEYSGFAIGRVERMQLTDNGKVSVTLAIPARDMRWVRATSSFELSSGFLGGSKIDVKTPNLDDPPFNTERIIDLLKPDLVRDIQQQAEVAIQQVQTILAGLADASQPGSIDAVLRQANALITSFDTIARQYQTFASPIDYLTGTPGSGQRADQLIAEVNTFVVDSRQQLAGEAGVLAGLRDVLVTTERQIALLEPTLRNLESTTGEIATAAADIQVIKDEVLAALASARESLARVQDLIGASSSAKLELP
jgi:phospholipid/cholesterol/gamma-HCH transport system substrate-binding protein